MIRDLACRQLLAHGPDVIAPFNSSATGRLSAETGLSITFLDAGLLGTEVENQVVTLDVAVMRRRSAIWAERDSAYIYIKTCTTQDADRNNALASGVDGVSRAAGLMSILSRLPKTSNSSMAVPPLVAVSLTNLA